MTGCSYLKWWRPSRLAQLLKRIYWLCWMIIAGFAQPQAIDGIGKSRLDILRSCGFPCFLLQESFLSLVFQPRHFVVNINRSCLLHRTKAFASF